MRICLYTNPVAGGWSPTNPDTWGGGEETIVYWSRAMAKLRHDVTVIYDGESCIGPGVSYLNRAQTPNVLKKCDVVVARKSPEVGNHVHSLPLILWTDQAIPGTYQSFNKIVACSPFMARCLSGAYPFVRSKLEVIPDGFDPEAFPLIS